MYEDFQVGWKDRTGAAAAAAAAAATTTEGTTWTEWDFEWRRAGSFEFWRRMCVQIAAAWNGHQSMASFQRAKSTIHTPTFQIPFSSISHLPLITSIKLTDQISNLQVDSCGNLPSFNHSIDAGWIDAGRHCGTSAAGRSHTGGGGGWGCGRSCGGADVDPYRNQRIIIQLITDMAALMRPSLTGMILTFNQYRWSWYFSSRCKHVSSCRKREAIKIQFPPFPPPPSSSSSSFVFMFFLFCSSSFLFCRIISFRRFSARVNDRYLRQRDGVNNQSE